MPATSPSCLTSSDPTFASTIRLTASSTGASASISSTSWPLSPRISDTRFTSPPSVDENDTCSLREPVPCRPKMLDGRCECGAVRYQVADEFLYASNCHCSRCRAATGSAFKPFAGIERGKLELLSGEDTLLINGEAELNDTRCANCGSLLYSVVRDGEYVHVALGSLVDEPSMRPTKHIFVGSKAPWFEITDDLPQFEEHATA